MTSPAADHIRAVRDALARHGISALLIPSADPHLSEYLPGRWKGRAWASGFTGSVGTLIVTPTFAGLWVDSRYYTQADNELAGSGIARMSLPASGSSAHIDWLAENLPQGGVLAVDGDVLGYATSKALKAALAKSGATLRTDLDLIGEAWADRPAMPTEPVVEHLPPFAIVTRAAKLARLREAMTKAGVDHHFASTLDDVAWLLNLRGSDVSYNPVFLAHVLVSPSEVTLFVGDGKIAPDLQARLAADGVRVERYENAKSALAALPAGAKLLLDPARVTLGLVEAVAKHATVVEVQNPTVLFKACKTAEEIAHVRTTMEYDGAALCELFAWLEGAVARGERITELSIDEQVCAARARRPNFVGPSFATIAGWNANGAMPHYRATPESHAVIEGDGLLLVDSGGQYQGGTTDITRVVAVGKVSDEIRRDVTAVLKGMIQLSLARFPRGIRGGLLDALARAPIWATLADFGHGTGHGVGYFLAVHEGPQGIAPGAAALPHAILEPGMITSNEPGLYRPGRWGVRIENLVLTIDAGKSEFGEFLAFETLTLCPIDVRCLDVTLLDARERAWLDGYHAEVQKRLLPHVDGDARAWLLRATVPLAST
ncbi:Xaa-Pro aminopeptidase [Labilithrix luteola]|uniref:Xaa-Pro aminopeptidase n=1 Tax=Labilithrix luteola TaxID=1391654 RepID=A0A0K1PPQ6_9BACT|nr:aminopeptidase P family protein [Labilithrix luteola]AKU95508.1 Xaa-Pro aminopeptidase [Labilithrix luteola]